MVIIKPWSELWTRQEFHRDDYNVEGGYLGTIRPNQLVFGPRFCFTSSKALYFHINVGCPPNFQLLLLLRSPHSILSLPASWIACTSTGFTDIYSTVDALQRSHHISVLGCVTATQLPESSTPFLSFLSR